MSGIYIHIPFCSTKCNYCNFYSTASGRNIEKVIQAICCEIDQRKDYLQGSTIETVYFGGGTPSLLQSSQIEAILNQVARNFHVDAAAEITLEANPDDLNKKKLQYLKQLGINRLSIGIQSFRQDDLQYLGRRHSVFQAQQSIEEALVSGFANLSIDLIYGIPTLSGEGWQENLSQAFSYPIPHISAYWLTVEEKTPLDLMIRKGKIETVNENLALSHYGLLVEMMLQKGYEHYEISNFCLPGKYSRHNTAYWLGKPYLGVGPSAHSFNGLERQWNVSNTNKYIESSAAGKVESEAELLKIETRYNEFIMTSLRTIWGCDLNHVSAKFGDSFATKLVKDVQIFIRQGKASIESGKLKLTPEGYLFADGIASALFVETD